MRMQEKETIKVLLLCLDMDPEAIQGDKEVGAAHLYVKETLEMLSHHNVDCVAITRYDDNRKSENKILYSGIGRVSLCRIEVGGISKQPKEYLWGRIYESTRKIRKILSNLNFVPNIIHAIYWYSGDVALGLMKEYSSAKLMYSIVSLGKIKHQWKYKDGSMKSKHDEDRERKEQKLFERADVIAAVSNQERENAIRLYHVDENKIFTIGRGVDSSLFNIREGRSQNIKRPILFVGRMIESKGYGFLLRVYEKLLLDPTIITPPLWLIGGTSHEIEEVKNNLSASNTIKAAIAQKLIVWKGIVPRSELPDIYRDALITCIPSYYEPGARVILESMACGTPVIMGYTGYANELVRPKMPHLGKGFTFENGFVANVDDESIDEWAMYIKSVIRDSVWRDTLSKRAHLSVFPHYSLEQFAERHWQLYNYAIYGVMPIYRGISFDAAYAIALHWASPYSEKSSLSQAKAKGIIKKILSAQGRNVPIELINGNNRGSTDVWYVYAGNETYFYKRYIDKTQFARRYFPFSWDSKLQYANMRYNLSDALAPIWSDQMFLEIIGKDENSASILFPFGKSFSITDWDGCELLMSAIQCIKNFHSRQAALPNYSYLKEQISKIELSNPVTWESLYKAYDRIAIINSFFHNNGKWYSPVRLDIEIALIGLGLHDNIWNLKASVIQEMYDEMHCLNISQYPNINIIWGECRHEHFIEWRDHSIKAIDTETISIGEEDYDFATLFFWRIDVFSSSVDDGDIGYNKDMIKKLFPESYERINAWIWVLSLHWYLRDYSRGNKTRLERFRKIMTSFSKS